VQELGWPADVGTLVGKGGGEAGFDAGDLGGGARDERGVFIGVVVGDFVVVLVDVDHAAGAEGLAHLGTELGCCEEGDQTS